MLLSVSEKTFEKEVLQSPGLVIVNFWAPWCGLCRMISPILLKWSSDLNRPIKLVSINADENLKLANTYRLKNLPTLLLFDRGVLVERIDHFHGREGLRQSLDRMMNSLLAQSA